tara:strand:- start:184 stop:468 length:285 start_codon:yes stop_codon:yes gene_type:complete
MNSAIPQAIPPVIRIAFISHLYCLRIRLPAIQKLNFLPFGRECFLRIVYNPTVRCVMDLGIVETISFVNLLSDDVKCVNHLFTPKVVGFLGPFL